MALKGKCSLHCGAYKQMTIRGVDASRSFTQKRQVQMKATVYHSFWPPEDVLAPPGYRQACSQRQGGAVMTHHRVVVTRHGGPDVLQVVETFSWRNLMQQGISRAACGGECQSCG